MSGEALARAALSLVGAPFRLHGRDPASGLDCLGVLALVCAATGRTARLPTGYALRSRRVPDADRHAAMLGLRPAAGEIARGDVLLLRTAPCQLHLAIAVSAASIVHAHAGLGKVVRGPLPPTWPVLGHWRAAPAAPLEDI
ncbi:hypothetical protein [Novosphingobium soli]|uniref:NlpC/P60 domain-containing protein n=1 Tax=Novosphingobium soli TaxID=574956 RepID=A0ABV6CS02_9SPHN